MKIRVQGLLFVLKKMEYYYKFNLCMVISIITSFCMVAMAEASEAMSLTAQTVDSTNNLIEESVGLFPIPLNCGLNTWAIRQVNGASRPTLLHLSSLGGGEQRTGSIESPEFSITVPVIHLLVRGWDGDKGQRNSNRIELIDAETKQVLRKAASPLSDSPKWIDWDVNELEGRRVKVRLVDGDASESYAWIGLNEVDAGSDFQVKFDELNNLMGWKPNTDTANPKIIEHSGIPFILGGPSVFTENQTSTIELGFEAQKLFFLGMTNTMDWGVPGWWYPKDYSRRFFVGDRLGEICIVYSDGSEQIYPLILGDNLWWGKHFHDFPEPFASNLQKSNALTELLNVYPAKPNSNGQYIAVLKPKTRTIKKIMFTDVIEKVGTPVIVAMTAEAVITDMITDNVSVMSGKFTKKLKDFIETHEMLPENKDAELRKARLKKVQNLIYTTVDNFPAHVEIDKPTGYDGPEVSFQGNIYAEILTNVFYHNLHQMSKKVDFEGMYHTSTVDAASFGAYWGFGTYDKEVGTYSNQVWSRDLGRAIQELVAFGKIDDAKRCVDYCFDKARLWNTRNDELVKIDGKRIPPHWCRNIADPRTQFNMGCFENDGHGLVMLSVYNLWRRLPDDYRQQWLQKRWADVKLAGDWIEWQFENTQLSNAKNGILYSDSECAFGYGNTAPGYSVYADFACMEALLAFAEMAESIGKKTEASQWQSRAKKMRSAIKKNYIVTNKKRPMVWTLKHAGWAFQSSLLGPLILQTDRNGFLVKSDNEFHRVNEASYLRLIRKWRGESPEHYDPYWHDDTDKQFLSSVGLQNLPFGTYGVAMGYGQGFVTQAALLLDRMDDAEQMLQWTARNIYYADYEPYIVPEGVEVHPSGKFWFRTGDLGNGVQQAEIMKALRIVIGVDDTDPAQLRIVPRIPSSWKKNTIKKLPVWVQGRNGIEQVLINYKLERNSESLHFDFEAEKRLQHGLSLRLGPFHKAPGISEVHVDGEFTKKITKSGDSYWLDIKTNAPMRKLSILINLNKEKNL